MLSIPFALSIHKFVNSVGADVGFASIIAVALLVLLYFAHAREAATLRDRLDEAQNRIAGLEQRLGQVMHMQAAMRQRGPVAGPGGAGPGFVAPGGVAPPPPGVAAARQAGAAAIPSVRRIPSPATSAATAAMALPGAGGEQPGGFPPAAPWGTGGPALASATRLIPVSARAFANGSASAASAAGGRAGADAAGTGSADTVLAPAAADAVTGVAAVGAGAGAAAGAAAGASVPAAGNGHGVGDPATVAAAVPERPRAAVAAAAARPSASPRRAAPPRVQIEEDDGVPAAAASRRPPSRYVVPDGTLDAGRGRGRGVSGRRLPLLIAAIAVVVIVIGLIVVITNKNGGATTGNVVHNSGGAGQVAAGAHRGKGHVKAPPFHAGDVTVSVLNGTSVGGLAGDVGKALAGEGYKKGNISNAASQTQKHTFVYYNSGSAAAANKTAAQHVASALQLPAARVRPAGPDVLKSCATSVSGKALGGCGAGVIVAVGTDRADLVTPPSS